MELERFSSVLPGKVWNMLCDVDQHLLALEVRNAATKKVSFYLLDLKKKTWVWDNVEFEEAWWLSLLSIEAGFIHLNYFPDEKNPIGKKIIKVDIAEMQVVDERNAEDVGAEILISEEVKVPLHYVEGSENFGTVQNFVAHHNNIGITKAVDYLEHADLVCISYYLYQQNKMMANYLLICNTEGEQMVEEQLGEALEMTGLHTFFAAREWVITVKNKNEIIVYDVKSI